MVGGPVGRGPVEERGLGRALERRVVVEHVRLAGVDVPLGDAGDLAGQRRGGEGVVEVAPLAVEVIAEAVVVDPAADRFEIVANPEEALPGNRFNDGKVDRRGRFWAGTMDDSEREASGTLYCVGPDFAWTAVDRDYKVTNGPAFSPAGDVMYHNDSARQVTYAFDLDVNGKASNRRTFLQFGPGDGYPDGMTVDAEGCLWIAFWDGWCVRRYSPEAQWIETIRMPVQRPTSCAFGGRDLDRLYVTSAGVDLDEDALNMQPNAGGLFMLVPGVRGLADVPYDG